MVGYKFAVKWDVKFTTPRHSLYGVIVTKRCRFPDISSATRFARAIQSKLPSGEQLVGKPVLENI
jgi:hypothetical protein